jgi:cytochrome c553
MRRTQIVLLALVLVAALLAAYVLLRNPEPPALPSDDTHAGPFDAEACLGCHGPDGGAPQSPTHPIGRDCARCHGLP